MDKYILDNQYNKYLEMIGINVREALILSDISETLFASKRPMLEENKYYKFMDNIGKQITDSSLLIKLASSDNIESFSPAIFAAYCSENAYQCCIRLSRYKRLIAPMKYQLTECNDSYKLEIGSSNDELLMPDFLIKTEFVFIINLIRKASKTNIIPIHIEGNINVIDKELNEFIGTDITKSNKNIITFKREDMNIPFTTYNSSMWDYLEPELKKRLYEFDIDDSYSKKVRSALVELLPGGLFSIDDVSKKIALSKRSLQRKLSEENTNFQKQLNQVREMLAKNYLMNSALSIDDITYLLGYQEVNSFLRSFNLWTGMTPAEYRRTCL